MTDIATQIASFFVNNGDIHEPGESVPHTSKDNVVAPLVDGDNYFHALRAEVDALKGVGGTGKFFYFSNWSLELAAYTGGSPTMQGVKGSWTHPLGPVKPFKLNDQQGGSYPDFIDELALMSTNGTDVRVLVWINPFIVKLEEAAKIAYYDVNAFNLLSVDELRHKPRMGQSACLNILGHPIGSMHLKMVVCGDSTGGRAYVSGIDFVNNRIDGQTHPNGGNPLTGAPTPDTPNPHGWHDVGAKVEGEAVQGIYNYYKLLWNELIDRSNKTRIDPPGDDDSKLYPETFRIGDVEVESVVKGTSKVPERIFRSPSTGLMHVQVLRTGPKMNFASGKTNPIPYNCFQRTVAGFRREPWSFAEDGIFEFKLLLKKAISNAQKYIYVEDQGFWGQPIMDWLRKALATNPDLKLIMVHRADPADDPEGLKWTSTAINDHLASAGANMASQVAYYERQDRVVIHSKTWIIDDQLVIIGSANCFRRSLYTDGETSVAILDEDATMNHIAIRYRNMLWAEHCGKYTDLERASFSDLAQAIKIWNPTWGIAGEPPSPQPAPGSLLPTFQIKKVPFEAGGISHRPDQFKDLSVCTVIDPSDPSDPCNVGYDKADADSRKEY
jgi:phosphatidylserine/phosphatidylglycerophosphate/cardiolipin synthase-like enzyme